MSVIELPNFIKAEEIDVLSLPPVGWDEHYLQGVPTGRSENLARSLAFLVVHVVRAYGYINARSLGKTHAQSVKASNQVVARVRPIVGFSVPRDDINF